MRTYCRWCGFVITEKDGRWYHIHTARYSCRDLADRKAQPR